MTAVSTVVIDGGFIAHAFQDHVVLGMAMNADVQKAIEDAFTQARLNPRRNEVIPKSWPEELECDRSIYGRIITVKIYIVCINDDLEYLTSADCGGNILYRMDVDLDSAVRNIIRDTMMNIIERNITVKENKMFYLGAEITQPSGFIPRQADSDYHKVISC